MLDLAGNTRSNETYLLSMFMYFIFDTLAEMFMALTCDISFFLHLKYQMWYYTKCASRFLYIWHHLCLTIVAKVIFYGKIFIVDCMWGNVVHVNVKNCKFICPLFV